MIKALGAYLQMITLLTDADEKDPAADTVKLMTIHAAKGLEFGCVFACGLEEMLFPSGMSINTREELEEERRLFYVVITRAKKDLWITYANTRYKFGSLVQNEPSRFINELPDALIDRSFSGGGARNHPGFLWIIILHCIRQNAPRLRQHRCTGRKKIWATFKIPYALIRFSKTHSKNGRTCSVA